MQSPKSRKTSREGVNAAQAFFEMCGCVFQEVAQQNDFGKDAYVDLAIDQIVTHLCVALQIKSGKSYRNANGDYFIPIDNHATNWRHSTVPVFGVVYDPEDQGLRWIDLTDYLKNNPEQSFGSVPVSKNSILDLQTLRNSFTLAVQKYEDKHNVALNLLAPDINIQVDAVFDAWALGRRNARYMILLRRVLIDLPKEATRRAIALLSHCGSHPDIFWTSDNWIPREVEKQITPSFRWAAAEIVHMLQVIDVEEYGRGTLGQCLLVLIVEDPDALNGLHGAIEILLEKNRRLLAVRAATLALWRAKNQRSELEELVEKFPQLLAEQWFAEISFAVRDFGFLSFD